MKIEIVLTLTVGTILHLSTVITKCLVITACILSWNTYIILYIRYTAEIRGRNMSIDYGIIGKRMKEKRQECSLTQEILAEKLGVSVGYISQIERGITRVNLDMLSNISLELDCDITYFISDVVPSGKGFLNEELSKIFEDMNHSQRKILLEIAETIKKNS